MQEHKSPTPPQSLVELQEWFSQAVCANSPEEEALLREKSTTFLTASATLDQNERLTIYMSDFWPRCLGSLAEDFPRLYRYLGETVFMDWMRQYVTACPSESYTLLHLGRRLPEFLRTHYCEKDNPFVCDIARFEWAQMEAQESPNSPRFDPDLLQEAQKESVTELPLSLHPSVRILSLDFPVHLPSKTRKKKTSLIVSRYDFEIHQIAVHPLFAQLLLCFQMQCSISDAVDALLNSLSKPEVYILETSIQNWITDAVTNGWFQHPQT